MTIRFACPRCRKVLKAPPERAGHKANCPQCGQRVSVPAAPTVVEARPLPPPDKTLLGEKPPDAWAEVVSGQQAPNPFDFDSQPPSQGRAPQLPPEVFEADTTAPPPSSTSGNQGTKYCFACGGAIDFRAEICPKCGVRQQTLPQAQLAMPPNKSYGIASLCCGLAGVLIFGFGFMLCFGWILSLVLGHIAVSMGKKAFKVDSDDVFAQIGLGLGYLVWILSFIAVAIAALALLAPHGTNARTKFSNITGTIGTR